jgi:glucokinase
VSSASAIGIDIGGTRLRTAAVTADGRILRQQRRPTPAADGASLLAAIEEQVREVGRVVPGAEAAPVGIGIAGLVGPDGMVRYGPNIGIRDLPVAEELTRRLERTVVVINDGSAAALGEQRVGAGHGRSNVVMFTIGTGVGGGIVIGGELVVGANGFAGELGHIIVERGGRRCPCGNRGCVEAYASGRSIGDLAAVRLVTDAQPSQLRDVEKVDGAAVSQAAADGDPLATALLQEVGSWLGIAIASCVNALDPEVVLVGGGAAPAVAPFVLPAARDTLGEHVIGHDFRGSPPIDLAVLGDDAGTVGAGLYAADRAERSTAIPEGRT